MIELKEFTKKFGSVTAVDAVSFQVEPGSIFGLVGSNGAGKSTLLRSICGVYAPDGGQVLLDGEAPYENPAVYRPALDSEALDELRDTLDIIKLEIQGSMVRFVARGSQEEIDRVMQHRNTIFYETLPLSLEEVFISEMEAAGYDLDRILS